MTLSLDICHMDKAKETKKKIMVNSNNKYFFQKINSATNNEISKYELKMMVF